MMIEMGLHAERSIVMEEYGQMVYYVAGSDLKRNKKRCSSGLQ